MYRKDKLAYFGATSTHFIIQYFVFHRANVCVCNFCTVTTSLLNWTLFGEVSFFSSCFCFGKTKICFRRNFIEPFWCVFILPIKRVVLHQACCSNLPGLLTAYSGTLCPVAHFVQWHTSTCYFMYMYLCICSLLVIWEALVTHCPLTR